MRRDNGIDDRGGAFADVPRRPVVKPEPMPDFDAHLHAGEDDLGERDQLDPHNKPASLFRAFTRTADDPAQR